MNNKYVCKHIIFTIIIWLCVFIPITAASVHHVHYNAEDVTGNHYGITSHDWSSPHTGGSSPYVVAYGSCYVYDNTADMYHLSMRILNGGDSLQWWGGDVLGYNSYEWEGATTWWYVDMNTAINSDCAHPATCTYSYIIDWLISINEVTNIISGDICGINNMDLYYNDTGNFYLIHTNVTTGSTTYSYKLADGAYKLIFNEIHTYEFIMNGTPIIYDYNMCDYQILHYVDDCSNLLINPLITIIKNDNYADPLILDGTSCTDVFIVGEDVELNDKLDIWIDTDQGCQYRKIYAGNKEDFLYHSFKSWNMDIKVYDINTSGYVSGAKVSVKQDCRINDYPHYTYGITNSYGYIKTYDLSNQQYQVKVEKNGYNIFGWQTINAGFDAQQTNIPLRINLQNSTQGDGNGTIGDPDGDNDGTGGDNETSLPETPCSIGWFNNSNNTISEINDTQDARLYFMAGNCTNKLYLERWNDAWIIIEDWTLPAKETGYKQLTSANWTQGETTIYRGRLWAYSCACDATDQLKIWNVSDDNVTIFENLTSNVHFRHKIGGQYINPNTPISILSYAASNNTTLMNIDLKLYNETVLVDTISYDVFDYWDGDSFNPLEWKPNYDYVPGFNYTVRMYGLNDALLDIDTVYANATGDNPFDTGNILCVHVFDQSSMPLANCYIYVEGWDNKPTGTDNKICFSGMPDDTYNYRATKPDYQDRGLSSVSVTSDKVVNYILDKISDVHSVSAARLTNRQIKDMYLPLMYMLFICILFGAFKYVSQ